MNVYYRSAFHSCLSIIFGSPDHSCRTNKCWLKSPLCSLTLVMMQQTAAQRQAKKERRRKPEARARRALKRRCEEPEPAPGTPEGPPPPDPVPEVTGEQDALLAGALAPPPESISYGLAPPSRPVRERTLGETVSTHAPPLEDPSATSRLQQVSLHIYWDFQNPTNQHSNCIPVLD